MTYSGSARSSRVVPSPRPSLRPRQGSSVAIHCPECGFVNAEGANYCQKCGAFLADVGEHHEGDDTTVAWQIGETGDLQAIDPETVGADSATLVIRAGGGRAGETFVIDGDQS